MLSIAQAVFGIGGSILSFVTNKDLRDWLANASTVAFNIQVADFSTSTIHFDDLHFHKIVQASDGKVLGQVKVDDKISLDVICRKIAISTINNRYDMPSGADSLTHSLVSYFIDQTLKYVKNPNTSPNERLAYVNSVKTLLSHFTKVEGFKFELTKSDEDKIAEIARLNTNKTKLIHSDQYRVITLTRVDDLSKVKILDADRFRRIFIALSSTHFDDSKMPFVFSDRDFLGVGGIVLDEYFSMLHNDTINNKFKFGGILSCLLAEFDKFLAGSVSANRATNAVDVIQKLVTILIDKGIEINERDEQLLASINTKLANYLGSNLSINFNKTLCLQVSIMVNDDHDGQQNSSASTASTDSKKGTAAVSSSDNAHNADANSNAVMNLASSGYKNVDNIGQARVLSSVAPTAVVSPADAALAAKVELTVSQLRAMAEADTKPQPQQQQSAPAATHAAAAATQNENGKGGKQQRN